MNERGHLLLLSRDHWTLVHLDDPADRQTLPAPDAGEAAKALAEILKRDHPHSGPLLIALHHEQCFAVPIQLEQRSRRMPYQTILYAIEDQLPWPAEEIVADVLWAGGGKGLAIVARLEILKELIAPLKDIDIAVVGLMPVALLAFQHVSHHHDLKNLDVLVWKDGVGFQVFGMQDGKPRYWWTARDAEELNRQLLLQSHGQPLRLGLVGSGETDSDALHAFGTVQQLENIQLHEAAIAQAQRLVDGIQSPLIDLRKSELTPADPNERLRRPLNAALAAVMLFLLLCAAAMLIRSSRYDQLAAEQTRKQTQIFSQLYPAQSPPLDIVGRLRSEQRRLAGLSGQESDVAPPRSAVALFHAAISSLPQELRFRLLELQIENDKLLLDGQAKSHGDAETIVASLRDKAGFDVEPPRSEAQANGAVDFSIVASVRTAPAGARP